MNRTVPGPTNWPDQKPRPRRGGLRAIDKGTLYDVSGKLRLVVHQIESGEYGEVTDVVLALRYVRQGQAGIRTIYTGKNDMGTLNLMADYLKRDMVGGLG